MFVNQVLFRHENVASDFFTFWNAGILLLLFTIIIIININIIIIYYLLLLFTIYYYQWYPRQLYRGPYCIKKPLTI